MKIAQSYSDIFHGNFNNSSLCTTSDEKRNTKRNENAEKFPQEITPLSQWTMPRRNPTPSAAIATSNKGGRDDGIVITIVLSCLGCGLSSFACILSVAAPTTARPAIVHEALGVVARGYAAQSKHFSGRTIGAIGHDEVHE